jgi:segregation and condensation protein A
MSETVLAEAPVGPAQSEIPFAIVKGEPFFALPKDLYIPPDALEVILEAFEGPLDLLLYLIRRQNLEILDIPIASITQQYVGYIDLMHDLRFELAAEYLVMAAILAEIKSRMLLPRVASASGDEDLDPRAELIRRLQEYERFKKAALDIDALPRMDRDTTLARTDTERTALPKLSVDVAIRELLLAMKDVMGRAELFSGHAIRREPLSVRARMSQILETLVARDFTPLTELFNVDEGRRGIVVSFLAALELLKEQLLDMVQNEPFGAIYLKLKPLEAPDGG